MLLRSAAPKAGDSQREVPVEETLRRIEPHLRTVGITRIADITDLDYIGVPVYTAVVPRSNDVLSVYSGKGATAPDARASAIMEAVERYAGWLPLRPTTVAPYAALARTTDDAVDPRSVNLELKRGYHDDLPIYWVEAHDLVSGRTVLVPHAAVTYAYDAGAPPCYRLVTTNGLASGNSLEEAVCHALSELIERDALTLAELIASRLPHVLARHADDPAVTLERVEWLQAQRRGLDLATLPPSAARLVERFAAVGVQLRLNDISSDIGLPSVLAVSWVGNGPADAAYSVSTSEIHTGVGTHPDVEVAIRRAITECAQSRAVDVQATREDIALPWTDVPSYQLFARRVNKVEKSGWPWKASHDIPYTQLPTFASRDVADDIKHMVSCLVEAGLERVLAVDLSPPDLPVSVARVVVPGLESWATDRSRLGERAARAWRTALRQLGAGDPR